MVDKNKRYKVNLTFKNVKCNILIKNIDDYEFEIYVKANKKLESKDLQALKNYLESEGFNDEARKCYSSRLR
jgi:hypothetical protein